MSRLRALEWSRFHSRKTRRAPGPAVSVRDRFFASRRSPGSSVRAASWSAPHRPGLEPGTVYTVFSDEELRDIREAVGWLTGAERSARLLEQYGRCPVVMVLSFSGETRFGSLR